MRTFEYSEGTSNKFWNVDLQGASFTVTYGKIGSKGQTSTKTFASEDAARKAHDKLVAEKLEKGYRETTAAAPVAPPQPPADDFAAGLESAPAGDDVRTFEFSDGSSDKFWNVRRDGAQLRITYGKIGSKGQTQLKTLADEAAAIRERDKLVAEKLKKGYQETTKAPTPPAPAKPVPPLQRSLEDALAENPDDLASHMAYADYLREQGDPRGEFIQVQLALEDPKRPDKERKRLQKREAELLSEHARAWLGDVGRFLGDWSGPDKPWRFSFARGWLDAVRLLPFPDAVIASLARSPEARLLRRLEIVYDMLYHPFDFDQVTAGPAAAMNEDEGEHDPHDTWDAMTVMPPLLASPHLGNLRVLKIGFSDDGDPPQHSTMVNPFGGCTGQQFIDLLEKCPRLEELYLNTQIDKAALLFASPAMGDLRVLQYYFGTTYPEDAYLAALADNDSLRRLTTLRLHAGRESTIELEPFNAILRSPNLPALTHLQVHLTTFGDEGARRVVESGVLNRLKVLDLGYGNMTDEGARILAGCFELRKLQTLDVSRNALTGAGIAALEATGVRVVAHGQHAADDTQYLWEVDVE